MIASDPRSRHPSASSPPLNAGDVDADIDTSSPVPGFRIVRCEGRQAALSSFLAPKPHPEHPPSQAGAPTAGALSGIPTDPAPPAHGAQAPSRGVLVRWWRQALSRRGARPRGRLGIGRAGGTRNADGRRMPVMSAIAFRRTAPDESRIYCDGDHVGDVYALDDPLREAVRYFVVHIDEDPRGPCRIHDRSRIREVTERLVLSHPLWS